MNKKKIKLRRIKRKLLQPYETNGRYSVPGQPSPLAVSFKELRDRAVKTPMLELFREEDVDVLRHSKIIDYSSSFLLAIVVLVILKDGEFFWQIQSCFVSKVSGSYIKLNLVPKKHRDDLRRALSEALGDCGVTKATIENHTANQYMWQVPFSEKDYEKLDRNFRNLIELEKDCKDDGYCEHCRNYFFNAHKCQNI